MYVYIQGGLTNSLKQIYGSASSVVALLDGNKGSGSNEGDEEPSVTPADHETGNKLADALSLSLIHISPRRILGGPETCLKRPGTMGIRRPLSVWGLFTCPDLGWNRTAGRR